MTASDESEAAEKAKMRRVLAIFGPAVFAGAFATRVTDPTVAEIAGEYAKKGRPLYIEGRLRMDTWEDKASGQKRSRMKVVGENLQLLGGRAEGGSRPAGRDASLHELFSTPL